VYVFIGLKINLKLFEQLFHGFKYFLNNSSYLSSDIRWLSQVPWERSAPIPYLLGPATHITHAGRILDWLRDPTQGSSSRAFSCTGPDLVPVLPVRCHHCAGASCRFGGADSIHDIKASLEKRVGSEEQLKRKKKRDWKCIHIN